MSAASRSRLVAVAGVAALTLAACDALLGLDKYSDVTCAVGDCGADVADTSTLTPDVRDSAPTVDVYEGGTDGSDAADGADAPDAPDGDAATVVPEAGYPTPTGHEIWAHWPMPNPDAAIAPDSATLLPHPMTYGAGDGGVYDAVTGLTWARDATLAPSIGGAWLVCTSLGPGWRVPTRIELVSLVDFTRAAPPTLDPTAFPDAGSDTYWTSSTVAGPDGGVTAYWSVSFATGLATYSGTPTAVRCVNGGAQ